MARIKKSLTMKLETRADAEVALGHLAELSYCRDMLTAELDLKLKTVREEYEGKIDPLTTTIDSEFEALSVWADGHPNEFGSRRSIDMVHGSIGYRQCPPKLKLLRGWSWDLVAAALQKIHSKYLRVKVEANKEALLDERDMISKEQFSDWGMSVVQDETFFVNPKQETA
jgi:phage host-nuclease inhibitor protein Gam